MRRRDKTRVERVSRHESSGNVREHGRTRWVINEGEEGIFDAIVSFHLKSLTLSFSRFLIMLLTLQKICSIGTCGSPKPLALPGQSTFLGQILHSSQLDNARLKGKKVVIIGSGASGVEAAELSVEKGAKDVIVFARSDKWIIPRNTVIDILLSLQPFGRQMVSFSSLSLSLSHTHFLEELIRIQGGFSVS